MIKNFKGLSADLVENAAFDGKFELPIIYNENKELIPEDMIPFDKRKLFRESLNYFINFYLNDSNFKQILTNLDKYIKELRNFKGVISPDFSLYRDMPNAIQLSNTYINRAIGHYMQSQGLYVIPNVRWSDSRSFEYCFDGLEKEGIYCISTHGCIKRKVDKYYLKKGLKVFIEKLMPKTVLVYGAMPDDIFYEFKDKTKFINYQSYTSRVFQGKRMGTGNNGKNKEFIKNGVV